MASPRASLAWHTGRSPSYYLRPLKVQLQLCLDLHDPIPSQPGSTLMLFPGYLSLLLLAVYFLLALYFDKQFSIHSCWSLTFHFLICCKRKLLRSIEVSLKICQLRFASLSLRALSQWVLLTNFLKSRNFLF